jgi:hypothetical protein
MSEELSKTERERLGKVEADVIHIDNTVSKLFAKFDDFVEKMQPRPTTPSQILGGFVLVLTMFAILFGSVIYIVNSSNAPLVAQMAAQANAQSTHNAQLANALSGIQAMLQQNSASIQLTNKEVSVNSAKTRENTESIQYMLFDIRIPEAMTALQKDVEYLKQKTHLHSSTGEVIKP